MKGVRYKKSGWHGESHRHYLAAKGVKTGRTKPKKYYYTPTYVAGDIPLIAADGLGTAGAATVGLIPLVVTAGALYVGARGVKRKTEGKSFFSEKGVKEIPIKVEKPDPDRIYPVSPQEVKKVMNNQNPEHIKGIKSVEFANPKGEQNGAWAQYVRSRKAIKVFSQPYNANKIDGRRPENVNKHMKEYVIPHEIGHHRALAIHKITDRDIRMAEARADAHVVGMAPNDRAVKMLVR